MAQRIWKPLLVTVDGDRVTTLVGQGEGSRRFSGVLFQGGNFDDHLTFKVSTYDFYTLTILRPLSSYILTIMLIVIQLCYNI